MCNAIWLQILRLTSLLQLIPVFIGNSTKNKDGEAPVWQSYLETGMIVIGVIVSIIAYVYVSNGTRQEHLKALGKGWTFVTLFTTLS